MRLALNFIGEMLCWLEMLHWRSHRNLKLSHVRGADLVTCLVVWSIFEAWSGIYATEASFGQDSVYTICLYFIYDPGVLQLNFYGSFIQSFTVGTGAGKS